MVTSAWPRVCMGIPPSQLPVRPCAWPCVCVAGHGLDSKPETFISAAVARHRHHHCHRHQHRRCHRHRHIVIIIVIVIVVIIIMAGTRLLSVPRTMTMLGMRSFAVTGPVIWNSLPAALYTTTLFPWRSAQHLMAHLFGWPAVRLKTTYDALYKFTQHHHHVLMFPVQSSIELLYAINHLFN